MPYCTKKMAKYMKEKGLSQVSDDDEGSNASKAKPKKKLREMPSAVSESGCSSSMASSSAAKSSAASSGSSAASSGSSAKSSAGSSKSSAKSSAGGSKAGSKASSSSGISKTSSASAASSAQSGAGSRKSSAGSVAASASKSKEPGASQVSLGGSPTATPDMSFDEKKLLYIKGLLKSQVKHIEQTSGSVSVDKEAKLFENYCIEEDKPIGGRPNSCEAIVKATHKQYNDYVLLCKIYDCKKAGLDAKNSLFFKVLRHLGKKHPGIIQTWDVFSKDGNTVYVLQEFAIHGPIDKYLNKPVDEKTGKFLAKQMFMAMDYMGDMGIAHRALHPGHVLVTHKDMVIKLTGFRNSVVYWNTHKEDINFLPCVPVSARPKEGDFQALEVYGDPEKEEFDPISADIWSFGACVYYFLTRKYPFDPAKENPNVDEEVMRNIDAIDVSKSGKKFLKKTLSTFANVRIQFDHINVHKWIRNVNI